VTAEAVDRVELRFPLVTAVASLGVNAMPLLPPRYIGGVIPSRPTKTMRFMRHFCGFGGQ
jgi:hypothetical protein